MRTSYIRSILGLLAFAAAGCAGAQVTQQSQAVPVTISRPAQIVVYPFAVSADDVTLNQGIIAASYRSFSGEDQTAQQLQIAKDTAHNICVTVATTLSQKGYSAVCQDRGVPVAGGNVLIVDGEFTDISEGNKLRRMVIGLGVGASTLDADVLVQQHSEQGSRQLMEFSTHADSGKMPGAGITGPAGAAAAGGVSAATIGVNLAMGGVKSYTSATGFLADKTSDEIVDQITQYYAQQGWSA
jgi:Domain of unknown function (DUF4410)